MTGKKKTDLEREALRELRDLREGLPEGIIGGVYNNIRRPEDIWFPSREKIAPQSEERSGDDEDVDFSTPTNRLRDP